MSCRTQPLPPLGNPSPTSLSTIPARPLVRQTPMSSSQVNFDCFQELMFLKARSFMHTGIFRLSYQEGITVSRLRFIALSSSQSAPKLQTNFVPPSPYPAGLFQLQMGSTTESISTSPSRSANMFVTTFSRSTFGLSFSHSPQILTDKPLRCKLNRSSSKRWERTMVPTHGATVLISGYLEGKSPEVLEVEVETMQFIMPTRGGEGVGLSQTPGKSKFGMPKTFAFTNRSMFSFANSFPRTKGQGNSSQPPR